MGSTATYQEQDEMVEFIQPTSKDLMAHDNNINRILIVLQALNFELFYKSFYGFSSNLVEKQAENDDKVRLVAFIKVALFYFGDLKDTINAIKTELINKKRVLSKEEFKNKSENEKIQNIGMEQKNDDFYTNLKVDKCNLYIADKPTVISNRFNKHEVRVNDRVIELKNTEEQHEIRLENVLQYFYNLNMDLITEEADITQELLKYFEFDLSTLYIKLFFYHKYPNSEDLASYANQNNFKIFISNLKNLLTDKEKIEYKKLKDVKYDQLVKENKIEKILKECRKNAHESILYQKKQQFRRVYYNLSYEIENNINQNEYLNDIMDILNDLILFVKENIEYSSNYTHDDDIIILKKIRDMQQVKELKELLSKKTDWESKDILDLKDLLEFDELTELTKENFECFNTLLRILSRNHNKSSIPLKNFTLKQFLQTGQKLYEEKDNNKEIFQNIIGNRIKKNELFADLQIKAFYHIKADSVIYLDKCYNFHERAANFIEWLNTNQFIPSSTIAKEERSNLHNSMNFMIRDFIYPHRILSLSEVFYNVYFAYNEKDDDGFLKDWSK